MDNNSPSPANNKALGAATPKASKEPLTKSLTKDSGGNNTKPARKITRTLEGLTRRSWNRFEAERDLHDHCLPSTVSEIQKTYDITVARKFETVPGYQGIPTKCCRYWLNQPEKAKAMKILGVAI